MANLRKSLEAAVETFGEPIEALVVGKHDGAAWDTAALPDENVLLPVEQGLAKLDQEYDCGYGVRGCFPLYAWTKSRVFFVQEYDGATGLGWVPRHPVDIEPSFSGE